MTGRWPMGLTRARLRLYPAITFCVLSAAALYNLFAGDGLVDATGTPVGGDFLSFYTGGAFTGAGAALELLDPEAQRQFQEQLLSRPDAPLAQWVSPPFFAWLFVPLAHIPYPWAYGTCVAASGALLVLSLTLLRQRWPALPGPLVLAWIALQYYPTLQCFLNGQTTVLWLLLFTLITICLREGRDFAAGLLLGCFACKPPLALGLTAALLGARRWQALGGAVLSAAVWLVLGFTTLPGAMTAYVAQAPGLLGVVRDPAYHRVALHGAFETALLLLDGWSPSLAVALGVLLNATLLLGLGGLWLRWPWQPKTPEWDRRFAATLALSLVASPHLYGYDLALLVLPFSILWAQYRACPPLEPPLGGGRLLALTAAVWALGLLGPALSVLQERATARLFGVPMALQLGVPVVVAWAFCMISPVPGLTQSAIAKAS